MKVEFDLRKTLARGKTINLQGDNMWLPFQYEKLSRMCFQCRCIVHKEQGCIQKSGSEAQFGPCLRAKSIGRMRNAEPPDIMSFLSWNCRGLGLENPRTVQDLCLLVNEKKLKLVF